MNVNNMQFEQLPQSFTRSELVGYDRGIRGLRQKRQCFLTKKRARRSQVRLVSERKRFVPLFAKKTLVKGTSDMTAESAKRRIFRTKKQVACRQTTGTDARGEFHALRKKNTGDRRRCE